MYDHNQLEIAESFLALHVVDGRLRPTQTRELLTARYELCETLAQQLFEYAQEQHHKHGLTEHEVLERCHAGLIGDASVVDKCEAGWVVRRLAELEGWECPPRLGAGCHAG
jgi:hypothetical protein